VMRPMAFVACLVVAGGLVSGCGNSSEVCADTQKTIEGFAAKAQTLPPTDTAKWRQAITDVANRLDTLSRRADDKKLKKALKDTAASYRAAAGGMSRGETAQLTAVIRDQPKRLDTACS
jgi:hypothetical protein